MSTYSAVHHKWVSLALRCGGYPIFFLGLQNLFALRLGSTYLGGLTGGLYVYRTICLFYPGVRVVLRGGEEYRHVFVAHFK